MDEKFKLKDAFLTIPDSKNIRKVYIEPTNSCNFSCKMCFKNTFVEKDGFMDNSTWENLKHSLKKLPHLKEVALAGIGEPLLHKDIKGMITFLKNELGCYLTLSSNGYLLGRFVDFIIDAGVDNIVVSVDNTPVGHLHNSVVYKTLKALIEKRKKLKADKPAVSIEIVLDKQSIKDAADTIESFLEIGVKDVIVSNILPVFEALCDQTLYPADESILKEIVDAVQAKASATLPYLSIKTERKCNFISKNATVVRWDGEVAPCYRFLHTSVEYVLGRKKQIYAHSFGNVNDKELIDIWNSRDYKWFRFIVEHSLYPSCIDCSLNSSCDFVKDTEIDCFGLSPSCGDCLWSRNIIICP
ncbi:tungsten cofactor oxidoreductase radical SAM maturase [Hippea jasoniae]|uniref:tungsten cofactor oxidoreductase radical SAM maturase n=1 Tax=Hippea jasoniae TaxID=944479 RepID=UPI00054E46B3|nr:tungsten cofactor oxidoreductase radical SAM maturase [Hippea jasoniae]